MEAALKAENFVDIKNMVGIFDFFFFFFFFFNIFSPYPLSCAWRFLFYFPYSLSFVSIGAQHERELRELGRHDSVQPFQPSKRKQEMIFSSASMMHIKECDFQYIAN